MRKLTILLTLMVLGISSVNAANYKLNEAALEQAFETSIDATTELDVFFAATESNFAPHMVNDDGLDKQTIALIIIAAQYVLTGGLLGIIPIHRIYLGCDGQTVKVVALYCVTLGGLGLLPLIDAIFLILDQSKSAYIDNPKFLMWAGNM